MKWPPVAEFLTAALALNLCVDAGRKVVRFVLDATTKISEKNTP